MIAIKISANAAYCNARDHWYDTYWISSYDLLANQSKFFAWLKAQGVNVSPTFKRTSWKVTDSMGVDPVGDYLEFDSERAASEFLLKWA